MPRKSFKDYSIASQESVLINEWINQDGKIAFENSVLNQKWDPYNYIYLSNKVTINSSKLLASTHLSKEDEFRIIATWFSSGTNLKGAGKEIGFCHDFKPLEENHYFDVKLNIDGSHVGEKFIVSLKLCLINRNSFSNISAIQPGSILWEDTNEIILEGQGSLFPMEVCKFPKSYSNANWYLDVGEMSAPVSGGLRLYINVEKTDLINNLNSKELSNDFFKIIYSDIARQIILRALHDEEFRSASIDSNTDYFKNGTVGKCAFDLIKMYLKKKPHELFNQYQLNPLEFERDIQHSFSHF
tara:strand:+ start:390 stop:1286 length:897 start_codon:yes stop_codon:yes gene_type:complete